MPDQPEAVQKGYYSSEELNKCNNIHAQDQFTKFYTLILSSHNKTGHYKYHILFALHIILSQGEKKFFFFHLASFVTFDGDTEAAENWA